MTSATGFRQFGLGSSGSLAKCSPPLLAGRLLSVLAWTGSLVFLARTRGNEAGLNLLILLCIPSCFVLALRCHPYWLGVFFLVAAFCLLRYSKALFLSSVFAAVSLQNFVVFSVLAGLPKKLSELLSARMHLAITFAAIGGGVLSNWVLYGGRYPTDFQSSPAYQPYLTFDGFTEAYIPLHLGLMGWFALLFRSQEGKPVAHGAARAGMIVLALALLWLFVDAPQGPIFRLCGMLGPAGILCGKLAVVAGTWFLFRHGWQLAAIAGIAAVGLATLPFFYERYSWLVIAGIYIAKLSADRECRFTLTNGFTAHSLQALVVTIAWLFAFVGSL